MSKRHRQLRVKDLPKVPTWRLERYSNPRPSSRKASTLPMRHIRPTDVLGLLLNDLLSHSYMYVSLCLFLSVSLCFSLYPLFFPFYFYVFLCLCMSISRFLYLQHGQNFKTIIVYLYPSLCMTLCLTNSLLLTLCISFPSLCM